MKFFSDFLITLTGLVLLISTAVTLFSVIAYFYDADTNSLIKITSVTIPVMVVSLIIAWWKKNVFGAMLGWLFPWF